MPSINLAANASLDAAGAPTRRIEIVAYTGGLLPVNGFDAPVVVDYDGLSLPESVPLLADHEDSLGAIVGQATSLVLDAGRLVVAGVVIPQSDAARQVVALHDSGFRWQASIGAHVSRVEDVPAGASIEVNGRLFTGPVCVARQATLREVSLVAVGADAHTSAIIAARAALLKGSGKMSFEDWAMSLGVDVASLDDAKRQKLMEIYGKETAPAAPIDAMPAQAPVAAGNDRQPTMSANASVNLQASRQAEAAEFARVLKIRRLCASHAELGEKAIAEGWDADKVELHILRAGAKHGHDVTATTHFRAAVAGGPKVLEAALCQAGRLKSVEKAFDERTLEAAHTQFRGQLSIGKLLLEAAWANGCDERHLTPGNASRILRAAFSNADIGGILSNVANKFLLEGFDTTAGIDIIDQIAYVRNVNDFKTNTMYRLIDGGEFEQVPRDGKIVSGKLSEESFTISAKTYGKLHKVPREDIINDDLGALDQLRGMIGMGAARKLLDVFWTEFQRAHATFFTTARGNYFDGSTSNLSSTSLAEALKLFRQQVTPQGTPLNIEPSMLLVPPALEVVAQELFTANSLALATTGKQPNINFFAGKYRPIISPYLNNAKYAASSATAWYLLAEPTPMGSAISVAYLGGQRTPVVESADADFDELGIQLRGYFDFGVAQQDYRFAVKSKGAA